MSIGFLNKSACYSCFDHWSSEKIKMQSQGYFMNCYFNPDLKPCPFFL